VSLREVEVYNTYGKGQLQGNKWVSTVQRCSRIWSSFSQYNQSLSSDSLRNLQTGPYKAIIACGCYLKSLEEYPCHLL